MAAKPYLFTVLQVGRPSSLDNRPGEATLADTYDLQLS
jgi:hypothetical protein